MTPVQMDVVLDSITEDWEELGVKFVPESIRQRIMELWNHVCLTTMELDGTDLRENLTASHASHLISAMTMIIDLRIKYEKT